MAVITNLSTDAAGVPLFGVGAVEPGASVEVDDTVAEALSGHPSWQVSTTPVVPSVPANDPQAVADTAVDAPPA